MALSKNSKIIIIGGHLTPALAVLEELSSSGYTNLVWIGTKYSQTKDRHLSAEYTLISQKHIKFVNFQTGKIWRRWTPATFFKGLYNLILIPYGFIRAFWLIITLKPTLVISFGGYLALPLIINARLLRKVTVTHEQTTTIGLANRIIAKFAHKVFVSWPQTLTKLNNKKVILTGNPIRQEIFKSTTSQFIFPNNLPLIYVTGGNQGANTINWRLLRILPDLLKEANVIHQTGKSDLTQDYQKALSLKQSLNEELRTRYIVRDNIFGEEIGEIFQKADLFVTRAGANTTTEILGTGKLSVLIPIPWSSHNEQLNNAKLIEQTGLGIILEQYDKMPPGELFAAIEKGLEAVRNQKSFLGAPMASCVAKASTLIKHDAASRIVKEIEQLF